MKVTSINNQPNFSGSFIIQGKISTHLKDKFRPYEAKVSQLIADKKYDLYAKESSSKSTMMFSTDKNFRNWFSVSKKDRNYEDVAKQAIEYHEQEFKRFITAEDRAFIRSKLYLTVGNGTIS